MRILVTGGCGFIGSNFIRFALSEKPSVEVVNLDLLTYAGSQKNLADVREDSRYSFVKGDIADADCVQWVMEKKKVAAVFNFAAESHVDRSLAGAAPFAHTNVKGTAVLLDAALKYGVKRFVQVSTDEVYGQLGEKGCFVETDILSPRNPYSATKAAADLLVQAYVTSMGLNAVITRSSNNYGPRQHTEKFIPMIISRALKNQSIPIYGDGQQVRDWLYVEDNCRGIWMAMKKGRTGEVYNLGGMADGEGDRRNVEVAKLILKTLDKPESLLKHVKDRPAHDRRYAVDFSKAWRELKWAPRIPFGRGLQDTVRWYWATLRDK